MSEWNDPEQNFFRPETPGETLIATVDGTEDVNGDEVFKLSPAEKQTVPVTGEDGDTIEKVLKEDAKVLVNYVTLRDFLKNHMNRDTVVRIEYKGTETSEESGNDYKTFNNQYLSQEAYENR